MYEKFGDEDVCGVIPKLDEATSGSSLSCTGVLTLTAGGGGAQYVPMAVKLEVSVKTGARGYGFEARYLS